MNEFMDVARSYSIVTLATVLLFVVFAINVVWYLYIRPWNHLPTPPGCYPLIGHVISLPKSHDRIKMREKRYMYGDSNLMWIFHHPSLVTRDPDVIQHVLTSNDFLDKGLTYWLLSDWIQEGILLAQGQKWRSRRKSLTNSFHFNILKGFCEIMDKHSVRLVKILGEFNGEAFDIFNIAKEFSLGIVCNTSMGIDIDNAEIHRYRENVRIIMQNVASRGLYPWRWYKCIFKFFKIGQEYYKHIDESHDFVKKIIENRIGYRQRNTTLEGNKIFIDTLLDLYEENEIDVAGMIEETTTFMFGGHDTISSSLSWCLFLLAHNSACQEKAYEEAKKISQIPDCNLDDRIKQMYYIECVVKESLRIFSAVPLIARSVQKDTVIKNMFIPKGTDIILDFLSLHRNERYWENPMSFNPDRFSKEVNNLSRNIFTFLPFAAGSRNCIGQRYAMFELKIVLYHILLNFEVFALQKVEELKEISELTLRNDGGLFLKFKNRL